MLIDPRGSIYNERRLHKHTPQEWKDHAWIVYGIREPEKEMKHTVFLTRPIDLKPYS